MLNIFKSKNHNEIFLKICNKNKIKKYIEFIIGCIIASMSYNLFLLPNNIVSGGVGGLAIIINKYININNSLFILISDIFLLIVSYFMLDKYKTKSSFLGSLLLPLFIFITANLRNYIIFDYKEKLLYSLFGGVISGLGSGMIYKAGFTTGGTDIVNQIISKYLKVGIGKSILIIDGSIVLLSIVSFGFQNILYSIITLYLISYISEKVILGTSDSKAFYIVTKKDKLIKEYIIDYLKKDVTIINAKGGYKKENSKILLCVLPTRDYYKLKEAVLLLDSNAFFLTTDAYEVVRNG